ncbi:MAG: inorganic phosphate transporter [Acidobacteriota bacterium]
MELQSLLLILALVFGFYMAWNIGANDVANAMGTSVGSGALTLKRAILLAAIFEFVGAFLVGSNVADTVRKGIFDPTLFQDQPTILAVGMIAALLSAGIWLQIATYFGWPVSTTHSIVGAVVGFGVVALGVGQIHWKEVAGIAGSWVLSPILAGATAFLVFRFLLRQIFYQPDPVASAKRITPFLAAAVAVVLAGVTGAKALQPFWKDHHLSDTHWPLLITLGLAVVGGTVAAVTARRLVNRLKEEPVPELHQYRAVFVNRSLDKALKHLRRIETITGGEIRDEARRLGREIRELSDIVEKQANHEVTHAAYQKVERVFAYLQVLSACFVAFAHGANDVANAIGPLSAAVQVLQHGVVAVRSSVPAWALGLGGVGIVAGLATWGWRVMQTIGRRITELTPTRGFAAEFSAALTILLASMLGMPISTTHTLVGAVLGVGLARGIGALNLNTIRDIVASWLITIPAGALLAVVLFEVMSFILL